MLMFLLYTGGMKCDMNVRFDGEKLFRTATNRFRAHKADGCESSKAVISINSVFRRHKSRRSV